MQEIEILIQDRILLFIVEATLLAPLIATLRNRPSSILCCSTTL